MARRRRRRGARTLSGTFHRWVLGAAYTLGAAAIVALFAVVGQAVQGQLTLAIGNNSYDFGFLVPLAGLGLGGGLLFKAARYFGVRI